MAIIFIYLFNNFDKVNRLHLDLLKKLLLNSMNPGNRVTLVLMIQL